MIQYELKRSRRRSVAIEVTRDCAVVVRAPMRMPKREIDAFVAAHEDWARKHLERMSERAPRPELTDEQLDGLKLMAREYLPGRTAYFAQIMGLTPSYIKITSGKTRLGSCNAKNGICFSCRLMRYPQEAIDYVIVHELAHIEHKNHGEAFYARIAEVLPDHKQRRKLLRYQG